MGDIETKVGNVERDINNFREMVSGAERLIQPWKLALILTNLFWALVFAAFIFLAYFTPTEIDVNQNQSLPEQTQEQSVKGAN